MKPSSRWPGAMVLVICLLLALQGLVNAVRPVLPWIIVGLGIAVVLGLVIWAILRRSTRW